MYKDKNKGLSVFSNSVLSLIKVEKVVNPPHSPVVKNSLLCTLKPLPIGSAEIKPISKQPIILTVHVAQGKVVER